MKLFMLYGPPGVGKFTVAKELAKLTGYKLIHNHLIVVLVASVFGFGTKIGSEVNNNIRQQIYKGAKQYKIPGLITTFVYYANRPRVKIHLKRLIQQSRKNHFQVCFVQLIADIKSLRKRIKNQSRVKFHKIVNAKKFEEVISREDVFSKLPEEIAKTLVIDNTNKSPREVASVIQRFYRLPC